MVCIPDAHGDVYSSPVASEVVGLVIGDIGITDVGRDLILEDHASNLQQISEDHCQVYDHAVSYLISLWRSRLHDLNLCTVKKHQS